MARSTSTHPSLAVALNLSRIYSPARIAGYFDGLSGLTQLGSVYKTLATFLKTMRYSQLTSTI